MPIQYLIKQNTYYDSVVLMNVSNTIEVLEGVQQAAAMMGTPLNLQFLQQAGLKIPQAQSIHADDLVIVIEAKTEQIAQHAIEKAQDMLTAQSHENQEVLAPRTLATALRKAPSANLVVISIPGEFAYRDVKNALSHDRHVFLFSDGMPLQEEQELKLLAKSRKLLLMGPECGTAIINHVGLGFANAINNGPIGIVGASGTGIQQVSTLLHALGSGISQVIGTGGRDLHDEIGGIMTIEALQYLMNDAKTKLIVLISKPPGSTLKKKLLSVIKKTTKPLVINLLGDEDTSYKSPLICPTRTLEETAYEAINLLSPNENPLEVFSPNYLLQIKTAGNEVDKLASHQKYIRGLFTGGSLCYESQMILTELVGSVFSNAPLTPTNHLQHLHDNQGHTCLDLGTREYTTGHPHPMIDPTFRNQQILVAARDPSTAVILLDIVIGYGSHPNPTAVIVPVLEEAQQIISNRNLHLPIVSSIIGTNLDPQGLSTLKSALQSVGVHVYSSNAQGTRVAAMIANRGKLPEASELARRLRE